MLVVEDGKNEALELSARNVPGLVVIRSDSLNIVDVLDADAIVITKPVDLDHVGGVRMTLEATQIILRPVISEKSMDQSTVNKYTFAVADDANKMQIKAAVEELFKVTVHQRQRADHEAQGEVPQPPPRAPGRLHVPLEEGRRDRQVRRLDRILRRGLDDAASEATSRPPPVAAS